MSMKQRNLSTIYLYIRCHSTVSVVRFCDVEWSAVGVECTLPEGEPDEVPYHLRIHVVDASHCPGRLR